MDKRTSEDKRQTTRRQFLVNSAASGLTFALTPSPFSSGKAASPQTLSMVSGGSDFQGLKDTFLNPPQAAKPLTRWWWFGGAATPEEITRELTMMRDAGLRGVELQPLYPLAVDDPARGIRNVRYFSSEWFDLLRHTLRETKRLGLQFDFTLGSGWPYGGPFISGRLAARKIEVLIQDATGPEDFSWPLCRLLTGPWSTGEGRIVAIVAVPVRDGESPDIRRAVVISDRLTGSYQYAGAGESLEWKVPPGRWKIMLFTDCPTGQQVEVPSVGMEGYVIDHFSRPALDLFLDAVGSRTIEELRPVAAPPFHSVFCDSLEVAGADWTFDFLREFASRRGYDLAPYLPALYEDVGDVTPHVRYDYHLTLSDLMLENFFGRLAEWARSQGMTARVQVHGAMADVMRGYGLADIPEGEEGFIFENVAMAEKGCTDRYVVNLAHRRLATSAAHLYNRPVVSAESYTALRMPEFLVTLEMMKAATDASFLDGINQIVNQGYSYSPPQVGKPGWVFYAPTLVNHNNIWWPHYQYLAGYIQRAAALLLKGVSINPIAVYVPLADVYAREGLGSLLIDGEIEAALGKSIPAEATLLMNLRRAGYDFDLMNDDALGRITKVEGGKLRGGTAAYSVVIIPDVRLMPSESMSRLAEFVLDGGLLIFMGRLPEAAPGLKAQEVHTNLLHEQQRRIWGPDSPSMGSVQQAGKGHAVLTDRAGVLTHLRAGLAPDFEILSDDGQAADPPAHENVGFLHRKLGDVDFFFLSNISQSTYTLRARFNVGHKAPERWNPETGATHESLVFEYVELPNGKFTEVHIRLEAFESCFIVFGSSGSPILTRTNYPGPLHFEQTGKKVRVQGVAEKAGEYFVTDSRGRSHRFTVPDVPAPYPLNGPWRLALGDKPAIALDRLQSWTELAEGKDYSGWGVYETTFDVRDLGSAREWLLDLGAVHETAEVVLNGRALGVAWKGSRRLSCTSALREGANSLRVRIGNLWIQKMHSAPKQDLKPVAETFGIRWPDYGQIQPNEIPPSGLLGPVRLVSLKRFELVLGTS